MKDFGEKFFKKVRINIVLKFGVSARWYGRVGEMVVRVEAEPMIM